MINTLALYCRCTHMFYEHRPLDGPCMNCKCPEFRGTEYPQAKQ